MSFAAQEKQVYYVGQDEIDIMFVIDYSGSMNGNDSQNIALQMLEAAIDILYTTKTRVGFVAFTHKILSYSEPVSIETKAQRDALKGKITSTPRGGDTDIGLALNEALSLIQGHTLPQNRKGRIMLLSDGLPDVDGSGTGRSTQQSYNDMNRVANECKELEVPLDTIAFGKNFTGETAVLNQIADISGGSSYRTEHPGVLIDIFGEVIQKQTFSILHPISISLSSGYEQFVELPLKDTFPDEANILVVSQTPLNDVTVTYPGRDINYSKSGFYFTTKVNSPDNENATVRILGRQNQEIKIYVVLYKNLGLYLNVPDEAQKNVPFAYDYYFVNAIDQAPVSNETFYKQFNEETYVTKEENGIPKTTIVDKYRERPVFADNKATSEILVRESGNYASELKIRGEYFAAGMKNIPLNVENSPPTGKLTMRTKYLLSSNLADNTYQLNDYFSDANHDLLTYEMVSATGPGAENIKLEGDQLKVAHKKAGKANIILRVSDPEGAVLETASTRFSIEPFWIYYFGLLMGLFLILAMLILYALLLQKKKKRVIIEQSGYMHLDSDSNADPPEFDLLSAYPYQVALDDVPAGTIPINAGFQGKLLAYFMKTPEGMEIEPLSFALYQMRERKVSLGRLLEVLNLDIDNLDPYNVFFKATETKELLFYHTSTNVTMIGSTLALNKLKYSINYGNKIYITSQDGEYDLELHYVSARN